MAEKKIEVDGEIYYHESVVNQLSEAIDSLSRRIDHRGRRIDEVLARYNQSETKKARWWKFWKF